MKLTPEEVLKLGSLSRIEIDSESLPDLQADLNRILEFAAILQEVDPDLPPYSLEYGGNIMREDVVAAPLGQAGATDLAPESQDGYLKVPRTVDTGGHGG